jgi:hypothetical protein
MGDSHCDLLRLIVGDLGLPEPERIEVDRLTEPYHRRDLRRNREKWFRSPVQAVLGEQIKKLRPKSEL